MGSVWILVVVCCLAAVPAAATVLISYEHYVYATSSDGIPIRADVNLPGATSWSAEFTKTGDPTAGNYGYVNYGCALATGRVRTYAFSRGVVSDSYPYGFTATGRVVQNRMVDGLTFTVPAGTYPDGVAVTLRGTLRGSIRSEVGAGCQFTAYANFGDQVFSLPLQYVGIEVGSILVFDEAIVLTLQLVAPGAEILQATEYDRSFSAYLANCIAWSVAYNDGSGNGSVSGDAEAQLHDGDNGLAITTLEVPPGVQWRSESGVFLSQVAAVPRIGPQARAPMLAPNYPNPFNPVTRIPFDLAADGAVDLAIHDLSGALVRRLIAGATYASGHHEAVWDGRDQAGRALPAGTYLCRIRTRQGTDARSLVLIK